MTETAVERVVSARLLAMVRGFDPLDAPPPESIVETLGYEEARTLALDLARFVEYLRDVQDEATWRMVALEDWESHVPGWVERGGAG